MSVPRSPGLVSLDLIAAEVNALHVTEQRQLMEYSGSLERSKRIARLQQNWDRGDHRPPKTGASRP